MAAVSYLDNKTASCDNNTADLLHTAVTSITMLYELLVRGVNVSAELKAEESWSHAISAVSVS